MAKKKSKKKSKNKKELFGYKTFTILGAVFHFIVYLFYNKTIYSNTLFWIYALLSGSVFGIYFIQKMKLLNPKSYKKLKGMKLKAYMYTICLIMILGGVIIFGNVLNGALLGLNYIGKNDNLSSGEYQIEKVNRASGLRLSRRNRTSSSRMSYPRVYFEKDGEIRSFRLRERYNTKKDYSKYQKIQLTISKGALGYEIIEDYKIVTKE